MTAQVPAKAASLDEFDIVASRRQAFCGARKLVWVIEDQGPELEEGDQHSTFARKRNGISIDQLLSSELLFCINSLIQVSLVFLSVIVFSLFNIEQIRKRRSRRTRIEYLAVLIQRRLVNRPAKMYITLPINRLPGYTYDVKDGRPL